jgi:uncharacterized protein DUF3592
MRIELNRAFPSRWRSWVALLGFFFGLCSLLALVVTIGEGWYEYSQSKWTPVTANILECQLETSHGANQDLVTIACRIGFRAGGEDIVTKVSSRGTRPGHDGFMQEWIEAHPDGSLISARYNPPNNKKVELLTPDAGLWGPHTPANLKVLGILLAACLLSLAIARVRPR